MDDNLISLGLGNIQDLLISLGLVKTPLNESVLNVNEEEAKKTTEKRNFYVEQLERIEELARKTRAFMIYFNAHNFLELYHNISDYFIQRYKDLKTIDKEDKEIFREWVSDIDKCNFCYLKRELDHFLSWLDFGHPEYIFKWRKDLKKQHDKEVIEIEEEPEEVDQVDQKIK